jgi:hypothetical protein
MKTCLLSYQRNQIRKIVLAIIKKSYITVAIAEIRFIDVFAGYWRELYWRGEIDLHWGLRWVLLNLFVRVEAVEFIDSIKLWHLGILTQWWTLWTPMLIDIAYRRIFILIVVIQILLILELFFSFLIFFLTLVITFVITLGLALPIIFFDNFLIKFWHLEFELFLTFFECTEEFFNLIDDFAIEVNSWIIWIIHSSMGMDAYCIVLVVIVTGEDRTAAHAYWSFVGIVQNLLLRISAHDLSGFHLSLHVGSGKILLCLVFEAWIAKDIDTLLGC